MSTGTTPAAPAVSTGPSLRTIIAVVATFQVMTVAMIIAGFIGYYELRLRPGPPPPPSLVVAVVAYHKGLGQSFGAIETGVRAGTLTDKTSIVAALSAHGKPVADAVAALVSANCDPASGKVTNAAALADAFGQVKTALGGK